MQLITDGTGWPRPWENALLAPPANCITYNTTKSIINLNWGTFYARALLLFQTVNCSALEISITLWHPTCISLIAFFSPSPSPFNPPFLSLFSHSLILSHFVFPLGCKGTIVFLLTLLFCLKWLYFLAYLEFGQSLICWLWREVILLEGFKTLCLTLMLVKKMYV